MRHSHDDHPNDSEAEGCEYCHLGYRPVTFFCKKLRGSYCDCDRGTRNSLDGDDSSVMYSSSDDHDSEDDYDDEEEESKGGGASHTSNTKRKRSGGSGGGGSGGGGSGGGGGTTTNSRRKKGPPTQYRKTNRSSAPHPLEGVDQTIRLSSLSSTSSNTPPFSVTKQRQGKGWWR